MTSAIFGVPVLPVALPACSRTFAAISPLVGRPLSLESGLKISQAEKPGAGDEEDGVVDSDGVVAFSILETSDPGSGYVSQMYASDFRRGVLARWIAGTRLTMSKLSTQKKNHGQD